MGLALVGVPLAGPGLLLPPVEDAEEPGGSANDLLVLAQGAAEDSVRAATVDRQETEKEVRK